MTAVEHTCSGLRSPCPPLLGRQLSSAQFSCAPACGVMLGPLSSAVHTGHGPCTTHLLMSEHQTSIPIALLCPLSSSPLHRPSPSLHSPHLPSNPITSPHLTSPHDIYSSSPPDMETSNPTGPLALISPVPRCPPGTAPPYTLTSLTLFKLPFLPPCLLPSFLPRPLFLNSNMPTLSSHPFPPCSPPLPPRPLLSPPSSPLAGQLPRVPPNKRLLLRC